MTPLPYSTPRSWPKQSRSIRPIYMNVASTSAGAGP